MKNIFFPIRAMNRNVTEDLFQCYVFRFICIENKHAGVD